MTTTTTTTALFTWPHEWLEESRHPVFSMSVGDQAYGFYFFSLPTWVELLTVMVGHMLVAALFSVFIYYTVLKSPRRCGDTLSFLLTFGVFLPFWVFAPRAALDQLQVQNKLFRFCLLVVTPTTAIFRLIEAFFGFTPQHAARSLGDFAFYYGSPLIVRFDEKTKRYVKASWRITLDHLVRFVLLLFTTGMYQSMFYLHPAWPKFGTPATDDFYELRHVINPQTWKVTALYAILLQQYLTTFGEGLTFATNVIAGVQTEALMHNPMFESESPSDFWGRRWNMLIHKCLKGAIYKPIRSMGGNKAMAVLGSFVASGLFHEWIIPCVFFDYPNVFGRNSVFFVWQAMLVAIEAAIGWTDSVQSLQKTLPRPVRSLLVILCGIPFGHWFLDSYVHSNFFHQGHMVFMALLPINHQ